MNFSKNLKELRQEKGMTQVELAKRLNVTDTAVRGWEKTKRQPTYEILCELAKVFNVTVGQLLGVEEYYG